MTIGTKLGEFRVERNLTLEQVAQAASLSKSCVSQSENDNCDPSLNSLRADKMRRSRRAVFAT